MSPKIVYAQFSTWVTPTVQVHRGEVWAADDPVVASHPDWFTDDPTEFTRHSGARPDTAAMPATPSVEQATAAPGERRNLKRG